MNKVITRKRYIIVRDGTHIMCGLARQYHFKPIDDIGDTQIKTYSSEKKAISGFERSWGIKIGNRCKVIEIEEVIKVKSDLCFGKEEAISKLNETQDNYDDVQSSVDIFKIQKLQKLDVDKTLNGKIFCIAGKLTEFDNHNALVYDIVTKGGTVVPSVTSKTQYLITNDKNSSGSKNKAAAKCGTKIISELDYILGNL